MSYIHVQCWIWIRLEMRLFSSSFCYSCFHGWMMYHFQSLWPSPSLLHLILIHNRFGSFRLNILIWRCDVCVKCDIPHATNFKCIELIRSTIYRMQIWIEMVVIHFKMGRRNKFRNWGKERVILKWILAYQIIDRYIMKTCYNFMYYTSCSIQSSKLIFYNLFKYFTGNVNRLHNTTSIESARSSTFDSIC